MSQLEKFELMAGMSHGDTVCSQRITRSHTSTGTPFYLEELLGYGALVDRLARVLLLSVVGHADLLQERNRGTEKYV